MTTQNLRPVNKQNPCPHCGKPDWCYRLEDLTVCKRGAEPTSGWYRTNKQDKDGSYFYAPVKTKISEKKPARPRQRRVWAYPTRNGEPLVRVVRIDDGNGKKIIWQEYWLTEPTLAKFRTEQFWVKLSQKDLETGKCTKAQFDLFQTLKEPLREQIPIYRYQDIQQAITSGQTIFVVEGETCADALWNLGLPATTNIGGSKKWKPSDSKDLLNAKIVICPDRDQPGLEHAQRIYQDFPQAQWLYPYPASSAWHNLPPSEGLDLADWISDFKLTAEDLLEVIEPTPRQFQLKEQKSSFNSQTSSLSNDSLTTAELIKEIDSVIEQGLTGSKLRTKLNQLANCSSFSINELKSLYQDRFEEISLSHDLDKIKEELEKILSAKASGLNLVQVLPRELANPLTQIAQWLNLRPEIYLTALLCGVSCLHHPMTKLIINHNTNFSVTPNLFGGIISPSSQKKSPVFKLMNIDPMQNLQRKAKAEYQQELRQYEQDVKTYERLCSEAKKSAAAQEQLDQDFPDGEPKPPKPRIYYFSNGTTEGIHSQIEAHPDQGLLYLKDELAGIFKSANQYRSGRGSDAEDLLSYYDGISNTVLRASGVVSDVENILLSVFGTIQPQVIEKLMGDHQDANGYWSRFIFVNQPLSPSKMPRDGGSFDLSVLINWIYEQFNHHSKIKRTFTLSHSAFDYYAHVYDRLEELRCAFDTLPAMGNVWGKSEGRIGKIAINLHLLKAIFEGKEEIPTEIDLDTIKSAVNLTIFYAKQIESLYSSQNDQSFSIMPNHLAKVIETAQAKNDWITPRDVIFKISSNLRKSVKSVDIQQWFQLLVDMGKGIVEKIGKTLKFKFVTTTGNNVGNIPEPIPINLSSPLVTNVTTVTNTVTSERNDEVRTMNYESNNEVRTRNEEKELNSSFIVHHSSLDDSGNTGNTGNNHSQTTDLQSFEPVTNTGNNIGNNTVSSEKLNDEQESLVFNYPNVIAEIDQQMQRLGWDLQTGQDYILKTYGKKSRQLLNNEQLFEFWTYLKSQPAWQKDQQAVLTHPDPRFNGKPVMIEFVQNAFTAIVKFLDDLTTSFEVPLIQLKPLL